MYLTGTRTGKLLLGRKCHLDGFLNSCILQKHVILQSERYTAEFFLFFFFFFFVYVKLGYWFIQSHCIVKRN